MDTGSEYSSASDSYASSKSSHGSSTGCACASCDSRRYVSRGGRHRRHQSGASQAELLISGLTQTLRTLQAMSEQERVLREQNQMRRNSKDTESSDDGKDAESTDDMDGESEMGGDLEASATVTRGDYEQRLDDQKAKKGLNNYQPGLTGS
ncbi:hypothetical protein Z517_03667 [Fonsecaea pedrosoi CBS 271.37]|uniref:Unplaced genomic scaffold supercont1.2, whole genome shotgun sequence n=1 Tax=Fonsecaea pedrosoi CBS 271.37 TaxID=1442368 RepID=A0A0D2FCT4_9EURO|nr:uncharacterized protein Z517_03667 [Fonsecaea pedrosoi CBS 271.37]KIW84417.1 hypothetical protein Z517_03667 [Fonsecaea pedrosoi CBS 271.37]